MNNKDNLEKFDAKFDECIFLDYSSISKASRLYNCKTLIIEECVHVG